MFFFHFSACRLPNYWMCDVNVTLNDFLFIIKLQGQLTLFTDDYKKEIVSKCHMDFRSPHPLPWSVTIINYVFWKFLTKKTAGYCNPLQRIPVSHFWVSKHCVASVFYSMRAAQHSFPLSSIFGTGTLYIALLSPRVGNKDNDNWWFPITVAKTYRPTRSRQTQNQNWSQHITTAVMLPKVDRLQRSLFPE